MSYGRSRVNTKCVSSLCVNVWRGLELAVEFTTQPQGKLGLRPLLAHSHALQVCLDEAAGHDRAEHVGVVEVECGMVI